MVASSTSDNVTASGEAPRLSFAKIHEPLEVPNLLALQTESFDRLIGNEKWQERLRLALEAGETGVAATSWTGVAGAGRVSASRPSKTSATRSMFPA